MSTFQLYLQLGLQHIADWQAYDHIVFVLALCAAYSPREWKKLLVLVTAFTLGHSLTLALAVLEVLNLPAALIEALIPITIILTAAYNIATAGSNLSAKQQIYHYFLAFDFGLIHGLGFSNYLRMLLGKSESILLPLFSFNVGLEVGQLLIVGVIMGLMWLFLNVLQMTQRDWKLVVSGAAAGIALTLLLAQFSGE